MLGGREEGWVEFKRFRQNVSIQLLMIQTGRPSAYNWGVLSSSAQHFYCNVICVVGEEQFFPYPSEFFGWYNNHIDIR